MRVKTTYGTARANFAKMYEQAHNGHIVIISRGCKKDVALISADELSGLQNTVHLLSSPKNAKRLCRSLNRAKTKRH
jgi:antitoxin YefM